MHVARQRDDRRRRAAAPRVPTWRTSAMTRSSDIPNAAQCSRSRRLAQLLAEPARRACPRRRCRPPRSRPRGSAAPARAATAATLPISRWSKSPCACSSNHSHSPGSSIERSSGGSSTRPARESIMISRERAEVAAVAPARALRPRGRRGTRTRAAAARRPRPRAARGRRRPAPGAPARGCPCAGRASRTRSPPTIRSSHQPVARMSSTQVRDVFQSSWTSWSSKTIAVGTVESSQRMCGSDHDVAVEPACTPRSRRSVSPGGTVGVAALRGSARRPPGATSSA